MPPPYEKPKVCSWFVGYCVLMCLIYLFIIGVGLLYPKFADIVDEEDMAVKIAGPIYVIVGLIFFIPFAIAPFLKPTPGVWIYDLVLICFGMTSCCCLPAAIPLLIFWIKPETKSYFGK